jgi:membrane protein DedA with SNARE-associated domain
MLHHWFATWMQLTHDWGYPGVFLLMAVESTVFPLPSEVVVPPAAYWAARGELSFWGVVLAAALGSWFGASISYWVARAAGRPLILKYGRFVFVPEKKWLLAEAWILRYAAAGVFFARLLPVVRHLVSLPAGAARMNFRTFSLTTLVGSFAWSWVLAWFGGAVLGDEPRLMQDPDALIHVLKTKLLWLVAAAAVMLLLYIAVDLLGRRAKAGAADAAGPNR